MAADRGSLAIDAPPVSVCIPSYNGEQHLRACLESVLAQTYGDFEVLVVDDASRDGTLALVETYAARDRRVRIVRNERNLGLVGNWNRCSALARGEWIKYAFQDDLLAPRCLEQMLRAARGGCPMVACARDFAFDRGAHPQSPAIYAGKKAKIERLFSQSPALGAREYCEALLDHRGDNLLGEPTAVLLHRSVFERYGVFNADLITYCDAEYWNRIGVNVGVVHVPEVLATFRVHGEATSQANARDRLFRADTLDKLLLLHEMAFSPMYAPLRSVAAARKPRVDLEHDFWESAYWARWKARRAARCPDPDPLAQHDFDALAARYPRLESIPMRFQFVRGVRAMRRHARRLVGVMP